MRLSESVYSLASLAMSGCSGFWKCDDAFFACAKWSNAKWSNANGQKWSNGGKCDDAFFAWEGGGGVGNSNTGRLGQTGP